MDSQDALDIGAPYQPSTRRRSACFSFEHRTGCRMPLLKGPTKNSKGASQKWFGRPVRLCSSKITCMRKVLLCCAWLHSSTPQLKYGEIDSFWRAGCIIRATC